MSQLIDKALEKTNETASHDREMYHKLLRRDAENAPSNNDGKRLRDLMKSLDLSSEQVQADRAIMVEIVQLESTCPTDEAIHEADEIAGKRCDEVQARMSKWQQETKPRLETEVSDLFSLANQMKIEKGETTQQLQRLYKQLIL